jgi:hypothetical protein
MYKQQIAELVIEHLRIRCIVSQRFDEQHDLAIATFMSYTSAYNFCINRISREMDKICPVWRLTDDTMFELFTYKPLNMQDDMLVMVYRTWFGIQFKIGTMIDDGIKFKCSYCLKLQILPNNPNDKVIVP